jgi:hypothetical protein
MTLIAAQVLFIGATDTRHYTRRQTLRTAALPQVGIPIEAQRVMPYAPLTRSRGRLEIDTLQLL